MILVSGTSLPVAPGMPEISITLSVASGASERSTSPSLVDSFAGFGASSLAPLSFDERGSPFFLRVVADGGALNRFSARPARVTF